MVRIFVASRRPCDADAFATSSYEMYLVPYPLSAEIFVRAAVNVVLPWSTWPIVPTFTCGFVRSNFSLATAAVLSKKTVNCKWCVQKNAAQDVAPAAQQPAITQCFEITLATFDGTSMYF